MTSSPTVEPAGVSERELLDMTMVRLIAAIGTQRVSVDLAKDAVQRLSVLDRDNAVLRQQLAELRLRQCACSWSDDDERVMDMCNAHKEACEQQLAELQAMWARDTKASGAAKTDLEDHVATLVNQRNDLRQQLAEMRGCTAPREFRDQTGAVVNPINRDELERRMQPSLPAGSLAIAIEDAQRTVAGWPGDVRAAMGVQPERQGADNGVFGRTDLPQVMVYTAQIACTWRTTVDPLSGWHQMVMFADHQRALDAVTKRPSPPQDDIVAGLRIVLNDYDLGEVTYRTHIERAIAALGEKEEK